MEPDRTLRSPSLTETLWLGLFVAAFVVGLAEAVLYLP